MKSMIEFLGAPVFMAGVQRIRRRPPPVEPDGNGGNVVRDSGEPPESAVLKVWHLLSGIAAVMAVLLTAHYMFIQSTVRQILQEHEAKGVRMQTLYEAHAEQDEKRFARLEDVDRERAVRLASIEARQENIERDLVIIKERQSQVRMKVGLSP